MYQEEKFSGYYIFPSAHSSGAKKLVLLITIERLTFRKLIKMTISM